MIDMKYELNDNYIFQSYLVRKKLKPIIQAGQLTKEQARVFLSEIKEEAVEYFKPFIGYMIDAGHGNFYESFKEFEQDTIMIRAVLCKR